MKGSLKIAICITAVVLLSLGCTNKKSGQADMALPAEPNYGDSTQWYMSDRQSGVDVFYIISTETGDYVLDGVTYHHADTYNDSLRGPLYSEMLGVDTLLSGQLNFYSPYYRQCSLQSFANKDSISVRFPIALGDVRRSFDYYLKHKNNGRPFILAGFSQGAIIMLELMKEMDENVFSRMVAAYAIGTSISQETVNSCPHIVAAQGAGDTGVTICYNSVRDASCSLWDKSAIAINPVNWKTDATSAILITEPSPLLPVAEQKKDTMNVHLDVSSGLVFVEGYTATDYVLPLIGREGNYHSREIWLYRQQLRENMALRAANFLKSRAH